MRHCCRRQLPPTTVTPPTIAALHGRLSKRMLILSARLPSCHPNRLSAAAILQAGALPDGAAARLAARFVSAGRLSLLTGGQPSSRRPPDGAAADHLPFLSIVCLSSLIGSQPSSRRTPRDSAETRAPRRWMGLMPCSWGIKRKKLRDTQKNQGWSQHHQKMSLLE